MLTIEQARAEILAHIRPPVAEEVALADAHGRVLAEDVTANHDVPPFNNSAMDGFAVGGTGRLRIVGESRAGAPFSGTLTADEAARISTGAAVPLGTAGIAPLEEADDQGEAVVVHTAHDHVRRAGEDLRAGTLVLARGTRMGPAELGVAAGAGRARVRVAARPRVAIVATGDEIVPPGEPLGPGQIHDSNAIALAALTREAGAEITVSLRAPDDLAGTVAALEEALTVCDLLLVSGGVSVGPHDHVRPALAQLGVTERFWRVALRPGKPTWFGTRGDQLVIGLPGNPVSALVTHVLFARPALAALLGATTTRARRRVALAEPLPRRADREEAVRVVLDEHGRARATGPQGSHVLSSMLGADGLVIVGRGEGEMAAGTLVDLEPLAYDA